MIGRRIFLVAFTVSLYICNPIVALSDILLRFKRGEFPVDADSIGLAVTQFLSTWILGLPILCFILWRIQISEIEHVHLTSFNEDRPFLSLLISFIVVFLVSWDVFFLIENFFNTNTLTLLYTALEIWLFLCLRVVLIFPRNYRGGDL